MSPLIDEMRAQIHATPLAAARPARRWARVVPATAAAVAVAACAVAVVLLVSGTGSSAPPAYGAVLHVSHGQRTVTITLHEEQDIPALNARLAAEHTRIRVVPVVRGCDAPVHSVSNGRVVPGSARTLRAVATYQDGRLLTVEAMTIAVDTIAGRTDVVPASADGMYGFGGGVVVGPAPPCLGIGRRDVITTH